MATTLIVHLVHGTWPAGPFKGGGNKLPASGSDCWFQTGHPFYKSLEQELRGRGFSPTILVLGWSGANSFAARADAAMVLAAVLDEFAKKGFRQLIIGHSHGGTIATQALPQMKQGAGSVEVVTLATPFLQTQRFSAAKSLWSLLYVTFPLLVVLFGALRYQTHGQDDAVYFVLFPVMILIGLAIGFSAKQISLVETETKPNVFVGARLLCVRGLADEAGLVISAGIGASHLLRGLLIRIGGWLHGTPDWVKIAGVIALYGAGFATYLGLIPLIYISSVAIGILLFFTAVFLLSVGQATLGRELVLSGLVLLSTVESTPDVTGGKLEIRTLASGASKTLRHSIWDHPDCVRTIIDWV